MKKRIILVVLLVLAAALAFSSCGNIANKKVESLQIISGAPTEIEVGETPDFSALKVKVTYNDGETKEVGYSDVTVSAIDTSKAGKAEYTVSYEGGSVKATINVKSSGSGIANVTLVSVSYLSGIQTEFFEGADFHTTDLKVTAHYSDGSSKTITSDKLVIVQGIDCDVAGEQTLIVEYEKKRCEIKINVLKIAPSRFSLVTSGFDGQILIGNSFDISTITGILHYNNFTTKEIDNSEITFSSVDAATVGTKTLVGTYQGMNAECTVEVLGIKSIVFSGFNTTIKFNETLDLSGLKATVTATNNEQFDITADKITVDKTDFDTTLDGVSQKITTISFSYFGSTQEYDIKVVAERSDAQLLSLEYVSGVKTKIFVGEAFDDSDILATANRSFGFSSVGKITKSDLTVSGEVKTSEAGVYVLTYSFTENGVTESFDLEITVAEPAPVDLVLNKNDLGWVVKGETLDVSVITATLCYDYAEKNTIIVNSELTITSADTSTAGKFEITVSYAGIEKKVAYEVVTATEIKNVVGIDPTVSLGSKAYEDADVEVEILLSNGETVFRTLNSGVTIDSSLYNSSVVGNTSLTVKFGDAEKTLTVEVVEVLADLVLQSIAIQTGTLKPSVFAGETYDYSAISVVVTYNYNITKICGIANGVTVTTVGSTDTAGTYTIIASYTHEGVTKTAEFAVEVKEIAATELVIKGSYKNSILLGDAFDTSGITAEIRYNNGTVKLASNPEFAFSIDVSTPGEKTLEITHVPTGLTSEITVRVIGIKSVTFNGIDARYKVNSAIDITDFTVTIVGMNEETYVRTYNANIVLPTLELDLTKSRETKEYVFTYCGVEYKQNIEVYAEFEDATLVDIEYVGATQVYRGDTFANRVVVKANYTYGFTKEYRLADGVSVSGGINTGVTGDYDVTVSYENKSIAVTVSVVNPKVTSLIINGAPYGIKGEEYNYGAINVTLNLENNTTVTDVLANLVDYAISADVDVTASGTKTLTLTANEKSYTYQVAVYEIEKIVISTDNFNNVVQFGSTFTTEGLGKIYVYLVGAQEPAIREVSDFTHNVNTAIMGDDYTITATYLGVVSEPVKVTVADQNFIITGVEDPASIVAWKNGTYSSKFLDSGYCYVVGDDNPFRYEIKFQMFDIINMIPDTRGIRYEGKSTVTLDGAPVGAEYVVIDENTHTFDFTENAIGKSFVITTSHKDYPDYVKSLTVTVVDGYNVHESIELNLLTNVNDSIGNSGKRMLNLLHPFLASNNVAGINNLTYDEYVSFVNGIKGLIIHDNMILQRSDFPDEYFFTTSSGEQYIWEAQSIFLRQFTKINLDNPASGNVVPETFNMYGNYFTIVSNNVPIVVEMGAVDKNGVASNQDNDISSSQLMRFTVSDEIVDRAKAENRFYAENYVTNFYALSIHDNDPSVAVQPELAQKRAKLGIIGIKFIRGTYNFKSVNAEAYFISMFPDEDDVVANFDYCTFYNAWNNHIMTWALNRIDRDSNNKYDGSVHDGYKPCILNITNSFIGKSGGPVIIAMNKTPDEEFNKLAGSGVEVNIDGKTNIFSYVKGNEAWFNAFGATGIAQTITNFNNFFVPNGAYFMTSVNGNSFMNMIFLNIDSEFNPATGAGVTTDLNGKLSIDGNAKIDMDDWSAGGNNYSYGHNTIVDAILAAAKQMGVVTMPPIFVSDMGGASYTDTKNLYFADLPGYTADQDKYAATHGNYLSMYIYNLGALFSFNETALETEPTPADCTVERITAPHGIN